jgi:hypothetical protein
VLLTLAFIAPLAVFAATTVTPIFGGGTGTSTTPGYGKVLVGGKNNEYEFVATSTFGSSGGGTVTSVQLGSPNSTLTIGGTNPVTTSGTINTDLNLTHGNSWTGLQQFTNASSSLFSAYGPAYFGGSATSSFSTTGALTLATPANCSGTQALTTSSGVVGCGTITVPTGANPSASAGLSAVNGSAATFMRSDGAPALSQSITPTWSNLHIFSAGASTTQLSVFTKAYFGGTATSTFDSAGNASFVGTLSVTGKTTLGAASTTDFTAGTSAGLPNSASCAGLNAGYLCFDTTDNQWQIGTSSASATYPAVAPTYIDMPLFYMSTSTWGTGTTTIMLDNVQHAYTMVSVKCITDAGSLWIDLYSGSNHLNILSASTTNNTFTFTTNRSQAVGNTLKVDIGTAASSPTKVQCTLSKTINPT